MFQIGSPIIQLKFSPLGGNFTSEIGISLKLGNTSKIFVNISLYTVHMIGARYPPPDWTLLFSKYIDANRCSSFIFVSNNSKL